MDTGGALRWFAEARASADKVRATEEEKKRQGQVDAIGETVKGNLSVQSLEGNQQMALTNLKDVLAKPMTQSAIDENTAKIGYYGGLRNQANANVGHINAETTKLGIDNFDNARLAKAIPTESLVSGWYTRNPGVINPYAADLSTQKAPTIPPMIPLYPIVGQQSSAMSTVFPSLAPAPNSQPFESVPPTSGVVRGIKKIGNKLTDWLTEEPARPRY